MLGYNFKLEKVLKYKKDIESVKKGVLGNISNKLDMEEDKLINYNEQRNELINEKNVIQQKTDIRSLKSYNNYLESITKDIKEQEKLIDNINFELENAKKELLKAVKEKKTLEKLKEKGSNQFVKEMEKKQEKLIDNIVSFKNISQK